MNDAKLPEIDDWDSLGMRLVVAAERAISSAPGWAGSPFPDKAVQVLSNRVARAIAAAGGFEIRTPHANLTDDERAQLESAIGQIEQAYKVIQEIEIADSEALSVYGLPKDLLDRLRTLHSRSEMAYIMMGPQ
jgi:hypothetical protein